MKRSLAFFRKAPVDVKRVVAEFCGFRGKHRDFTEHGVQLLRLCDEFKRKYRTPANEHTFLLLWYKDRRFRKLSQQVWRHLELDVQQAVPSMDLMRQLVHDYVILRNNETMRYIEKGWVPIYKGDQCFPSFIDLYRHARNDTVRQNIKNWFPACKSQPDHTHYLTKNRYERGLMNEHADLSQVVRMALRMSGQPGNQWHACGKMAKFLAIRYMKQPKPGQGDYLPLHDIHLLLGSTREVMKRSQVYKTNHSFRYRNPHELEYMVLRLSEFA